jgi:hypothetical protein
MNARHGLRVTVVQITLPDQRETFTPHPLAPEAGEPGAGSPEFSDAYLPAIHRISAQYAERPVFPHPLGNAVE